MKFYLFTTHHIDQNPARNAELLKCLEINTKKFDYVYLFGDEPKDHLKITWVPYFDRPYITDFLEHIKAINDPNGVFVMANADIFFTNLFLHQLRDLYAKNDQYFCSLSRWDVFNFENENSFTAQPFLRRDSSDCWIIKGIPKFTKANYKIGIPGVDNKFPFEAHNAGYIVVNPSEDLKTYHLHTSNVRNYALPDGNVIDRYPPPYLMVEPCKLENL